MGLLGGPSKCPICDRPLVPDEDEGWRLVGGARPMGWFLTHCQSDHQDYLVWKGAKRRLTTVLGITTAIIFDFLLAYTFYILGIKLPSGRAGGGPFLLVAVPAFLLWWPLVNRLGIRKFRHEWQVRGGVPASQTPLQ